MTTLALQAIEPHLESFFDATTRLCRQSLEGLHFGEASEWADALFAAALDAKITIGAADRGSVKTRHAIAVVGGIAAAWFVEEERALGGAALAYAGGRGKGKRRGRK